MQKLILLIFCLFLSGCTAPDCKTKEIKRKCIIIERQFQPTSMRWGKEIQWHFKYWCEDGRQINSQKNLKDSFYTFEDEITCE